MAKRKAKIDANTPAAAAPAAAIEAPRKRGRPRKVVTTEAVMAPSTPVASPKKAAAAGAVAAPRRGRPPKNCSAVAAAAPAPAAAAPKAKPGSKPKASSHAVPAADFAGALTSFVNWATQMTNTTMQQMQARIDSLEFAVSGVRANGAVQAPSTVVDADKQSDWSKQVARAQSLNMPVVERVETVDS